MKNLMDKIISLCKRRGFIFPSSEIYGGMANTWDYGPLGVELKNNIKQMWWKKFVQDRDDVVGIDSTLIMNPEVWKVSGHLGAGFADLLVECKGCHARFKADEMGYEMVQVENASSKSFKRPANIKCPNCGSGDFTDPDFFNLMFKTFVGPKGEEENNIAYLRPETAQGIFINFKNILDTTHKKIPFGIAQIGKAFRNEITPGNFIFRTREFEQMEIEYFVKEENWKKYFDEWLNEMRDWINLLGFKKENITEYDVEKKELAHYSKKTIDVEYNFPFGRKELYGLAYRTDFDLKNHKLLYKNLSTEEEFIPHVIEPSLGVDRSVLATLCEHYHEEKAPTADGKQEIRTVLQFPYWLSPIKVAILPLSKKEKLSKTAKQIFNDLKKEFICEYDETQSIGKRYRRQDEIGTPLCVTVDFDTLKDRAVTIRNRDSMKQERIKIKDLKSIIKKKLDEKY
ncbi:glycine--tRNA ligase [bacterium]|nr:MAG: glycine--tRNA ligase [bacterium]